MFVSMIEATALVPGADYVIVPKSEGCKMLTYGKFEYLRNGEAVFTSLYNRSIVGFKVELYEFYPEYDVNASIADDDDYK